MKNLLKGLCICLLVFGGSLLLTSCKNEVKFDESKKTLIVGLECDYPPFNWLETADTDSNVPVNGQNGMYAEGYDIQMAKLICAELGYELVIEMTDWKSLPTALKVGKIDAIIAGMSPTEERKEAISFTNDYYRSTHVVLVDGNGSYKDAKTFADFSGAKVMGQADTTYEKLANQLVEKCGSATEVNPLKSVPEIIFALNTGVVDVTILEEPVAKGLVRAYPNLKYFTLDTPFEIEEADAVVSIGLRHIDTELLADINAALAKISTETRNALMENAVASQENE